MKITIVHYLTLVIHLSIGKLSYECKVRCNFEHMWEKYPTLLLIIIEPDNVSLIKYIFFSVAVIICFLICWTPYHVQRIMFVIVTKKDLWNERILDIQDTLHTIAGKTHFITLISNVNTSGNLFNLLNPHLNSLSWPSN